MHSNPVRAPDSLLPLGVPIDKAQQLLSLACRAPCCQSPSRGRLYCSILHRLASLIVACWPRAVPQFVLILWPRPFVVTDSKAVGEARPDMHDVTKKKT